MKKMITLLLVLVLAVGIVGCSSKSDSGNSSNNTSGTNNKSSEVKTENKQISEVKILNLGDQVSLPNFVDFTVEKVSWETALKASKAGEKKAQDGQTIFAIRGTMKNTSGAAYSPSSLGNMLIKMKFNDKYEYTGNIDNSTNLSSLYLRPLESDGYYLYVSVPNEIKNTFEKCVIDFGFNNDFKYSNLKPIEELPNHYQITITK